MESMQYLVFALQGLGDALEATPLIDALRRAEPDATIDVAVSRGGPAQLFRELDAYVQRVIELPYWDRGPLAFARAMIGNARRRRYDASFMTYPAAKPVYGLVAAAFSAKRRIGHRYQRPTPQSGLRAYSDLVGVRTAHNVDRNLDLLAPLGIARPAEPRYLVPSHWRSRRPRRHGSITIHAGTIAHDGFEHKRWPLAYFAEFARYMLSAGHGVTLLAGPDEVEETRELAVLATGAQTFSGPLEEAARHLSEAALIVTNDSGIGHLGAALGTPVLALFGPTPTSGSPFGEASVALRLSDCPPCFDPLARGITCIRDIDYRCLRRDLPVEAVIERALTILERDAIGA